MRLASAVAAVNAASPADRPAAEADLEAALADVRRPLTRSQELERHLAEGMAVWLRGGTP